MAAFSSAGDDASSAAPFPDRALIEEMEYIRDPAVLYLPGGRIGAVNRAAARLADIPAVGMTLTELIGSYETYRADGSPLRRGDLPCARALRGEVVGHGERVAMTLPDGSVYRALVTATPILRDGRVVAALSVWHDFDAYLRTLTAPPEPPGAD